jgi:hypothetical protein
MVQNGKEIILPGMSFARYRWCRISGRHITQKKKIAPPIFYGFLTLFRVQYNILFMAAMILGGSDEKISV